MTNDGPIFLNFDGIDNSTTSLLTGKKLKSYFDNGNHGTLYLHYQFDESKGLYWQLQHIRTSEDKLSFKDSSTPGSRYPRVTELSFELGLFVIEAKGFVELG